MACSNLKRAALQRMLPAIQSSLALLVRAHAAYRGNLVLGRKFKKTLAA